MATVSPRSNAQGVAFEIPIEKKELSGSSQSTVQQRLVAQANSPRREIISLHDIDKKLSEATERKIGQAQASVVKAKTHNAKVDKVYEKTKEEKTEKIVNLENHIRAKLRNAEAKRDGLANNWVRRLSFRAKDKLKRAAKVLEDEKWSAKELGTKIDIKGISAELRREESKLKTQDQLVVLNHDKLRRGQLALGMAEIEAQRVENRSEQKIVSANHRREMKQILASARIGEIEREKREKVADSRRQEEEEARKRQAEIAKKMKLAEARKQQAIQGKVEMVSMRINDKMQRVAGVRRVQEKQTREKDELFSARVELANQRREHLLLEQQALLQGRASKKERLVEQKEEEEEKTNAQKQKEIQTKLLSANARKEDLLAGKVKQAQSDQQRKKERAKKSWISSLNDSKELRQTSEQRLKNAADRKNRLLKEKINAFEGVNKSKIDKIDKMNLKKQVQEMQSLVEIQKKLDVASAIRESNLVAKSSSKKRMRSPHTSPASKNEVQARLDSANLRREICLAAKREKAKSNSPVKKTLFTALSPKQSVEDRSREDRSPRIKAKLQHSGHEDSIPESNPNHIVGLNVPLIAIGGIAFVLVGLLSFLKSK